MKTKSRMLAIVMALIMIVGMLPIRAFAEGEATPSEGEAPAQTQKTTATTSEPTTLPEQTPMQGDLTEEQPSPTNYTLTLKAEPDESGTVEGGGSYGAGTEVTVTATAKDSYVFTAWYEDAEERGDEDKRSEDAEYTFTLNGDLTLYAVFTQQPQADEQTPATPTDGEPGENKDVKSGDTGDGATGEKQETPAASTFTVTFDANGHGTAPEAASVTEGETVEKPDDPAEEGFSFNGWYRDKEATDEWDFDKDTVSGNISLYASWTEAEPESESESEPELTYPAFDQSKTVNGVTVHVSASEGVFPEGAELTVDAVPNTQVETAVAAQRDDSVNVAVSYTFDIKVMKDGQECQPGENQIVTVSFAMAQASDQNLDATIYHIEDDTADALDTTAAGGEVSAETDGFSIYTVEFTYNSLEYVLPGNTSVSMSEILTAVGLAGEPTKAVSSAPELFSVEKEDGIWTVAAKRAFHTEETLTVTINGTDYAITVTDDDSGSSSGYGLINDIPVSDGGYVWMGGDNPVRWHIIGESSSNYLLISADLLGGTMTWNSALRYCGTVFSGFSSAEQAAVPVTSKSEPDGYQYGSENGHYLEASSINGNMFLLSAEEAETYFSGNTARQPGWWWTRSPIINYVPDAGAVNGDGTVVSGFAYIFSGTGQFGVRPAFQLNRESILFESLAEGGKPETDSGFGAYIEPAAAQDRKLTLIDSSRSGFAASAASTVVASGGNIAIEYSGVTSGDCVSVMLCDTSGAILYYASVTPDSSGSSTWNLAIPSEIAEGIYTLRVFSEQRNGDKKTDYASPMKEIALTVSNSAEITYTVTYKVMGGTWADGSTADKTEAVASGAALSNVPTGMIASSGYAGGAWDSDPGTASITAAMTFTYTFEAAPVTTYTVTYKVVNGTWPDGSTADKTETVAIGESPVSVPTGMIPAPGYSGGAWDVDPASAVITEPTTFTYSFTNHPVIYKVVNGTWADGTTKDKTEAVGSGTSPTRVPANMIPAPGYSGGAWDVNPASAVITGATTFTYTFQNHNVTYTLANGTWADGSTEDKTESVASGASPNSVPTGMLAPEGFDRGAWDTDPTSAVITEPTTFTYSFAKSSGLVNDIPPSQGARIWMGGDEPIRWHIIGQDSGHYLLIADDLVGELMSWDEAQSCCGALYSGFTNVEKLAVPQTKKIEPTDYQYERRGVHYGPWLIWGHLFLLSAEEAETYFRSNEARKPGGWWLRTPLLDDETWAAVVERAGDVGHAQKGSVYSSFDSVDSGLRARPAFQLDRSYVFFSSAAEGGKSSAAAGSGSFGALRKASGANGDEAKLTLTDITRSGFSASADSSAALTPGAALPVTYGGVTPGDYVSALLCDQSGNILYHASLAPDSTGAGTWNMTLPVGLDSGSYTLKVFSEQQNEDRKTDYASAPVEIGLTVGSVPSVPYTVTVNNGSGSGEYADGASVTITANAPEAGMRFKAWAGTEGLIFTQGRRTSATATFTMPLGDVTVTATYRPDTPMYTVRLTQEDGTEKLIELDCEAGDSIDTLAARLQDEIDVPPELQQLSYNGTLLEYGRTLADYGIAKGDIIDLVVLPVTYPLWVGGVQATNRNASDILGDGTASFDPDSGTLALNNASITSVNGSYSNIYAENMDLTVSLDGSNNLSNGTHALRVEGGDITLTGGGNLTVSGKSGVIYAGGNLEINGCVINATALNGWSIRSDGTITITDSNVTAVSSGYNAISSRYLMAIAGDSRVSAQANSPALSLYDNLIIGEGLGITTPAGGYFDEYDSNIKDVNGNIAKSVVIERPVTTYTVTYKVVGGTWEDGTPADKTEIVTSGASPSSVPTGMIASSGFTGGAWDTDPSIAIITENTTFTYTFEAYAFGNDNKPGYSVKFDANVSANASTTCVGSMEGQSFAYDEKKALSANGYALPGYDFVGWNTKADGTGTTYADRAEVENLTDAGDTVALYAQWSAKAYTICFWSDSVGSQKHLQTAYFDQPGKLERYSDVAFGWDSSEMLLDGWDVSSYFYENGDDFVNLCGAPDADGNVADAVMVAKWSPTKVTDMIGLIIWDDGRDRYSDRPESVTVRLLANGTEAGVQEVRKGAFYDDWLFSFVDCPIVDEEGRKIIYTLTMDGIPGYTSYVDKSGDYGFRITNTLIVPDENKTIAIIDPAPEPYDLTCNGEDQSLAKAGFSANGTVMYALGDDAETAPSEDEYSDKVPVGTKVGDYYIWYYVKGDYLHFDSEAKCVIAHIAPVEYVVAVKGGTADKTTARIGETVTITADPPAEGKAFVQWPHIDGVDYDRADSVTTTFIMPAKDVEFTPVYADILIPTIADQTYTGKAITPRFSLFSGVRFDGVDRLLVQDMHYDVTYDKNIDAGEATLTVTMKAPSAGSKTATFKILPVDIEVTTGSATKDVYDGTPLTCQTGATITGLVNGETATVRATGSQTDVGTSDNTYEIEWGTAKAGNYNIAKETLGTLTVASPKPVTVTANNTSKTYGQADPTLTATATGFVGSDTVNYTISRETGEDVGTYAITPTGEAAQGNYTVSFVPGTFTIEKAPLMLGLSIEGWTAGQYDAHKNTPVLTGNTGNGAVTYEYKLTAANEADYDMTVPTAAGNYTVRATVAETVNYKGGEATAEFTVSPAPPAPATVTGIKLNSDNAKKVYTEGDALDVSGLMLEISKSDGSKEPVNVTEAMVTGFDSSKPGKQTLTVTYEGFTDTYEIEVKAKTNPPTPSTISYTAKDGSGNTIQSVTWQKGSGKNLDLTFKRSEDDHLTYGLFGSLEIGGVTVGSANYDTAEGSLKLSVKPEYLETLSVGDHTVKVNFQDGSATVKLTVKAATSNPDTGANITSPKTGDESNLALWSGLMILSLTGMLVVAMATKRRRKTR